MLTTAAIFSDYMVLQRNKRIAVWGSSDAPSVSICLHGQEQEVCVEQDVADGKWYAELPPQEAGGPYRLEITSGKDWITFEDVMIGEVWLAGGQSNMEFELQNCKGGGQIVKNATPGSVRFYYTPKVAWLGEELAEAERTSAWELFTPEACAKWSAVGYFFAERIAKELGVTVGIIGCNWGGTSASCWMGRKALEEYKSLSSYLEEYDKATDGQDEETYLKEYQAYVEYQARFDRQVGEYYKTNPDANWDEAIALFGENQYPGPMGPRNFTRPCGLYETMLQRVMPYTLAGFLYYQAEEDDHKPRIYDTLLTALIRQWRKDWKDDALPFLIVQLPVFRNEGEDDYQNWAFLREAQMRVFQTVRNTGIAVTLELGEDRNIHPLDKKPVGERLALQALYSVYRKIKEKEAFGPIYRDYHIEDDRLVTEFDHAEDGIVFESEDDLGFELAGADRHYYQAKAYADGYKIVLSAAEVPKPVSARYCWTNYRKVAVFGSNHLPMAPFRTDKADGAVAYGSRQGRIFN